MSLSEQARDIVADRHASQARLDELIDSAISPAVPLSTREADEREGKLEHLKQVKLTKTLKAVERAQAAKAIFMNPHLRDTDVALKIAEHYNK
eukprot:COSAG01_NODE_5308_length_4342_cov_29.521329_4_plen_93_part_00